MTSGSTIPHRLARRTDDLAIVQRSSHLINDLGRDLDRRLLGERRTGERMQMLRETTNRITRVANDAVLAYQRTSRTLRDELARADGDRAAAARMRKRLEAARADVLHALEIAKRRYPESTDETESAGTP
jgi:hypothetical protein